LFFQKTAKESGTDPSWELVPLRGGRFGSGYRRMNMMQIMYTHECKWKSETCLNHPRNEGEGDKRELWRG
jgi:hypothetical protein